VLLLGVVWELLWDEGVVGWWFRRLAVVVALISLLVIWLHVMM